MTEARRVFYRELIDEDCGNQKRLFSVIKRLLGSGREIQFPSFKEKVALANTFGEFFAQKIVTIQGKLDEMSPYVSSRNTDSHPKVSSIEPMTSFTLLSEHEGRKFIEATPNSPSWGMWGYRPTTSIVTRIAPSGNLSKSLSFFRKSLVSFTYEEI